MATPDGRESAGLSEQLRREAYRFDFFQAVRLLESLARQEGRPSQGAVGLDHAPGEEIVRFRATPALSFPAGAIAQLQQSTAPELNVSFLGLTGPQGVLPQHYTTSLLQRIRSKDYALRDFLDIFNHRAVSLFYRAWEKYRLPSSYERSRFDSHEAEELCSWSLYCLSGFGTDGLRGRLAIDDEALLYYSGHFAHYPRSASALESMLQDYFEVPVSVEQAQGQWLALDQKDQSTLSCCEDDESLHATLGGDLIVGERVWDIQNKFRVRLGPLGYEDFRRFMPNGTGLRSLSHMSRAFVGSELDFDVQPTLQPEEVPDCKLSAEELETRCLGWDIWVHNESFSAEVEDAVFDVEESEMGVLDAA